MTLIPEELEFFAGQKEIEIIPNFDCTTMCLITRDLGPFKTGIPAKVPLWVALHLRAQNKCTIIPPSWMNKTNLEVVKNLEINSFFFAPPPSEHYMEVAKLIFEAAPQDVPDVDEVKALLKALWDTRWAKLRSAVLTYLAKGALWAKVENLTQFEISYTRPYFPQVLEQFQRFKEGIKVSWLNTLSSATQR